ncbi:MAG: DapH/DapD/GlmU-related protein [Candidatus Omnitrophota bacterium]
MADYFQHEKALVSPEAKIGKGCRIWAFTNIQDGAVVGEGCNVCDGCFIEGGAVIGNNVTLKNGVSVFNGITIEDDVFCGANVAFINDRFPRSHRSIPWTLEKTVVKKGATIGANVTLLCGIMVGEYAFIGAGSVVTKDVVPHGLVYGNPAALHGYACHCGKKLDDYLTCACGAVYEKGPDGVVRKKG